MNKLKFDAAKSNAKISYVRMRHADTDCGMRQHIYRTMDERPVTFCIVSFSARPVVVTFIVMLLN